MKLRELYKNTSIIYFQLIIATLILAIFSYSSIHQISELKKNRDIMRNENEIFRQAVNNINDSQTLFKIQVQEWKNILLRGHNPDDFDRFYSAFKSQENRVNEYLEKAQTLIEKLQIGETQVLVKKTIDKHKELGELYEKGLSLYNINEINSYKKIDQFVRGIDRELDKSLEELVTKTKEDYREAINAQDLFIESELQNIKGHMLVLYLIGTILVIIFGIALFKLKNYNERLKEEKLKAKEEEELYRETLSSVSDTVIIVDEKQDFIFACPNVRHNLGYSHMEIVELKNLNKILQEQLFSPEEIPNVDNEIINREAKLINKNGEQITLMFNIKRILYKGTEAVLLCGRNITERKKAEIEIVNAKMEAIRANKRKSEFFSNMSHEIRTPLNSIVGFTDLLEEMELDEEKKEFLNIIKHSSNQLLELINDILCLSKVEAGKFTTDETVVNLLEEIELEAKPYQKQLDEKGLHLILELDQRINKEVLISQNGLTKILNNLLSNAIKFTKKGYVKLKVKDLDNQKLKIYVKDTGSGINQKKQEKLFEKYEQGDIDLDYGGTGLGLPIVKKIVEHLGGSLEVNSKIGEGTEFTIIIPYKETDKKKVIEKKADISLKQGLKIISVDDEEFNQKLLKKILSKHDIFFKRVPDTKKLLDELAEKKYDIVLMDIQMPKTSGLDATRLIRKSSNNSDIPVLAVSAYAFDGEVKIILEAGINDYISKPINKVELISKINKLTKGNEA